MPPQTLSSADVTSFHALDTTIDSDEGPRHLLIFTGIAASRWDSKGLLDSQTFLVNLGPVFQELPKEHDWTAVVSLSNVSNKDSDFVYAINAISLALRPTTQELQLSVDIAVLGVGGIAVLDSFSFQVTVLTDPPKIELDKLLIKGSAFAPTAQTSTGSGWSGEVILKSPAPRAVDVVVFSGLPSVAPMQTPGDPSFKSVTIKKGDTSVIFDAPPTFLPNGPAVNVNIAAVLTSGISTAVLTVLPPAA